MSEINSQQVTFTADECVGMTVNQYLFELRLPKGDFARALGLPGGSVTRRLLGDTTWSVQDLVRAAEWLGLELADLAPTADEQTGWLPAPYVPGKAKGPALSNQALPSRARRDSNPQPSDP